MNFIRVIMKLWLLKSLLIVIAICLNFSSSAFSGNNRVIHGNVYSPSGEPLEGVSVLLQNQGQTSIGAATDNTGGFILNTYPAIAGDYKLIIKAIGYYDTSIALSSKIETTTRINITLSEKPINVGSMVVHPSLPLTEKTLDIPREQLAREARHALIATNPVGAIRSPQVAREGSYHSSRLNINGLNPVYYVNGIDMSRNPDHYGMFSILPGPVIENLSLVTSASDASINSPAVIEFATVKPFNQNPNSEIDLSFIDGTGSIFMGDNKFYFLTSIRKSVLDRLADELNSSSSGRSIPPTNFRDIFISSGTRVSRSTTLFIDSYIANDYLSYNLNGTQMNPDGITTCQNTGERFLSLRMENLTSNLLFKAGAAVKENSEDYSAGSIERHSQEAFHVNLSSYTRTFYGNTSLEYQYKATGIKIGGNLKYDNDKYLRMSQTNWNFLPPDAASDIPYIYQSELNRYYGSYENRDSQISGAAFLNIAQDYAGYRLQSGVRGEQFDYLAKKLIPVYRLSLMRKPRSYGTSIISYGTFAETPVGRVLNPYQVLIDDNLSNLLPIETTQFTLKHEIGSLSLVIFRQTSSNLPRIAPDFTKVSNHSDPDSGFISIKSDGKLKSYGLDIGLNLNKVFSQRLKIKTYYAYGKTVKTTYGVTVPYEFSSPHRLYGSLEYNLSKSLIIGGDFSSHTGYRFSTIPTAVNPHDLNIYTEDFYRMALREENSHRFNLNLIANIYAEMNCGHCRVFGVVSNITNRKNSIIKTADGFVYDARLLPSIGLKYQF